MTIRVGTFNCENLFSRFRFRGNRVPRRQDRFTRNELAFASFTDSSKSLTGRAIRATDADILCLQEVENLDTLDTFISRYLRGMDYDHRAVIDGNDPRFIDVAVLSRYPFFALNTHRHERRRNSHVTIFSRDCLEVTVDVDGDLLDLYVNHFKSMMGGRERTRDRRLEQARRVRDIINEHWRGWDYDANFIVCGDLNDYPGQGTSLNPLLNHPHLENVVNRLPAEDRWTHYYASGNSYTQLDYLLLSQTLADANPNAVPGIMREGLPRRATRYTGRRLRGVGQNTPKASDHAALYIDIDLA